MQLKFMAMVYQHQVKHGQWFLHEHPAGASSCSLKEIMNSEMKIMNLIDVSADTEMENNLDNYDEDINSYRQAWDDVSGEELDLVR